MGLLYLIFAILGLGFLIFIHELGHYWMARRVGMRVESFGIGFGRPIFSFEHNGVKWNICWLPFGGYVKIAGMEKENGKEPDQIQDGFFGKSPWDRIKVAIMGPMANLLLGLVFFSLIWVAGGRDKNYAEVTSKIGWIEPRSELYKAGVRPGDIVLKYDDERVKGPKDHFRAAMTGGARVHIEGLHWDGGQYVPFSIDVTPYPHPQALESGILTTGVLSSASGIIYPTGPDSSLPQGSPLLGSGIMPGDRIVWVDGEPIYSLAELSTLLNDKHVLLTVKRGDDLVLLRVPRVALEELKLSREVKDEIKDWQWEADLKTIPFSQLSFIPYNITPDCKIEKPLDFIDKEKEIARGMLQPGDIIVACDGQPVRASYQLLTGLQHHKVLIVVERGVKTVTIDWSDADSFFDRSIHGQDLQAIVESIGTGHTLRHKGSLFLLKPVEPKNRRDLFLTQERAAQIASELEEEKRHIQAIDDPEKRAVALRFLENRDKQLLLGLPGVQDIRVHYDPSPIQMFDDVLDEVLHTLSALVGGYLNPKWISGPIGIVQVIHHQWSSGIKEALFWLGAISLNLGLLNLLPLPVLDGGYILLSLFEIVTGRRLKPKTVEKIVVPFAILLISFLIFLTYHDLIRLLGSLIRW